MKPEKLSNILHEVYMLLVDFRFAVPVVLHNLRRLAIGKKRRADEDARSSESMALMLQSMPENIQLQFLIDLDKKNEDIQ